MAVGILQPSSRPVLDPPGTCLFDPPADDLDGSSLKHDKRNPELILRPQPSDDINDPLNFSRLKKELIYFTLIFGASVTGVTGPLYVPFTVGLAGVFDCSVTDIVVITGYLVLAYGVASLLVVIASGIVGRRGMYLATSSVLFGSLIWGAKAESYTSLLLARIFQGIGLSSFGCLANTTISDIFFLHEQGWRIALWQLSFNGSVSIAPVLSGIIIQKTSWQVATYILAGFCGFVFLCVIFIFPETAYRRTPQVEREESPQIGSSSVEEKKAFGFAVELRQSAELHGQKTSYLRGLKIWGPRTNDEKIVTLLIRPVVLLFTPSVFYSMLLYTFSFSWFVILGGIYSQIFGGPPYSLSVSAVGYISGIGPFIGCIIALLASGPLADYSARFLSRRNDGIFEPEMRLIPVIPGAILSTIGSFGLGFAIQAGGSYWAPAILVAFLVAGISFLLFASIAYAAAAYPARGGDTFGVIMISKALFVWGITRIINDWLTNSGPVSFFVALGSITLFLSLSGIPMYIYGKRLRQWSSTSRLAWALL